MSWMTDPDFGREELDSRDELVDPLDCAEDLIEALGQIRLLEARNADSATTIYELSAALAEEVAAHHATKALALEYAAQVRDRLADLRHLHEKIRRMFPHRVDL